MPTVLISGGSGMIGKNLSKVLIEKGYTVIILTRNKNISVKETGLPVTYSYWNIEKEEIDTDAIAKADYIIHLAGANVAEKRWTKKRRDEIVNSRVKSAELLVKAARETPNSIKAVISASAIGWYGPDNKQSLEMGFVEDDPADNSFLGETCRLWEQCIYPFKDMGKRLVILRTGIVLSNTGGAFAEYKKIVRKGIAPMFGSGSQIVSWIHIDDICRMYLFALENDRMRGSYNAVTSTPVPYKELIKKLAIKIRHKHYLTIPVPGFVLKMILGKMSVEILKSATVNSDKIRNAGFHFIYPTIDAAINQLVHPTE